MYDKETISIAKHILNTQAAALEVSQHRKKLVLGIPKENHKEEKRIALTPIAVELLAKAGHTTIIERDAGMGANYSNLAYSEAGAIITDSREEVFKSDLILKISPFTLADTALLSDKQIIISALNLASQTKDVILKLLKKRVSAIALEYIKNDANSYPMVKSMSALAGKLSINIASHYLSNHTKGKGVLLGGITGIPPAEVVIIGASTAAENAAKAALGLGAVVRIFDKSLHKLNEIQQRIGQFVYTSLIQDHALEKALSKAEVVISALSPDSIDYRCMISREMVKKMKKSSIIIDLNIDNGSCIETSKAMPIYNPVYEEYGVLHYCSYNITSQVARTASVVLSNLVVGYLEKIGEMGGITNLLKADTGFRNGAYIFNGILTNSLLGNKLSLNTKDINLLMAAF